MVTGTVIRIGQVNMLESSRVYQCDKCHHQSVVKVTEHDVSVVVKVALVKVDLEQHYVIPKPNRLSIIIITSVVLWYF